MKTYFIFLCLAISGELAVATTQATVNQDKPPRLYVKSYSESDNPSGTEHGTCVYWWGPGDDPQFGTNTFTHHQTINEHINWQDGAPGIYTKTTHYQESNIHGPNGTRDDITTLSWPQSLWPNVYGTEVVSSTGDWTYDWPYIWHTNTFSTSTYTNQGVPIYQEYCDINISSNWTAYVNCSFPVQATDRRAAQTILKLQTGGTATSKLRNLFKLTGGASKIDYVVVGSYGNLSKTAINIPSQNITIGSYGALNTNGVLYKSLPDNADVDVTPYVAGVDFYSFNISQQKYHSYFDLFVDQPNPGYSFLPVSSGTFGHAFWGLRTDVPNALLLIPTTLIAALGTNGFEPGTNGYICSSDPGQLDNSAHSANIKRTFAIGFDKLLDGLNYVESIKYAPPAYCWSGINCVAIAVFTGEHAGVHVLPGDQSPQNFGVTLVQMYPDHSNPFWSTNIFYSPY